jgi:hypothetical protein
VYVPVGWRHSIEGSDKMVYFRGNGRALGIAQSPTPKPDPVADWTQQEQSRVGDGHFPGYKRERMAEVPGYFVRTGDWEFTFDGKSSRQHVNNRGIVASPVQAYGIWWQTAHSDWDAARPDLDLILASFRPKR